jgi:hypothetical protein
MCRLRQLSRTEKKFALSSPVHPQAIHDSPADSEEAMSDRNSKCATVICQADTARAGNVGRTSGTRSHSRQISSAIKRRRDGRHSRNPHQPPCRHGHINRTTSRSSPSRRLRQRPNHLVVGRPTQTSNPRSPPRCWTPEEAGKSGMQLKLHSRSRVPIPRAQCTSSRPNWIRPAATSALVLSRTEAMPVAANEEPPG